MDEITKKTKKYEVHKNDRFSNRQKNNSIAQYVFLFYI